MRNDLDTWLDTQEFDETFDRNFKRAARFAWVGFAVSLVLSAAALIVAGWAFVTLVQWVVTK